MKMVEKERAMIGKVWQNKARREV